jgi:aerobic carbon-monoxide dehydrogenase medium subunit
MKPAAFEYVRPNSLREALDALAQHGGAAKILAGGQSLVPMMNLRVVKPEVLIDINRIPQLDHIRYENGALAIGALARHSAILASPLVAKHCPLMAEAYRHVAHLPIRNRGTLAGNISHGDPASEMPAVLAVCDAKIVAANASGARMIAASDFFIGPLETALGIGEMVTEIRVASAAEAQGWAWEEAANRKGDFAMAGVAVTLNIANDRCTHAAIAVAGMEKPGVRLRATEQQLIGGPINDERIGAAARQAAAEVNPTDSYHADPEYKRELVAALVERALTAARDRCR